MRFQIHPREVREREDREREEEIKRKRMTREEQEQRKREEEQRKREHQREGERMLEAERGRVMRRLLDLVMAEKLCDRSTGPLSPSGSTWSVITESLGSGERTVEYYINVYSERLGKNRAVVQHILGLPVVEVRLPRSALEGGRVNRDCVLLKAVLAIVLVAGRLSWLGEAPVHSSSTS